MSSDLAQAQVRIVTPTKYEPAKPVEESKNVGDGTTYVAAADSANHADLLERQHNFKFNAVASRVPDLNRLAGDAAVRHRHAARPRSRRGHGTAVAATDYRHQSD